MYSRLIYVQKMCDQDGHYNTNEDHKINDDLLYCKYEKVNDCIGSKLYDKNDNVVFEKIKVNENNYKLKKFCLKKLENKEYVKEKLKLPELYDHQISSLIYSENQEKLTLVIPCGAGKTLIIYKLTIDEIEKNNNVLILIPSLFLLSQTFRVFVDYYENISNIILVGSDHNDEEKVDVNITTKSSEISKFLNENKKSIIISTYQSCDKVIESLNENKIKL